MLKCMSFDCGVVLKVLKIFERKSLKIIVKKIVKIGIKVDLKKMKRG
jgi:hypothetical protein